MEKRFGVVGWEDIPANCKGVWPLFSFREKSPPTSLNHVRIESFRPFAASQWQADIPELSVVFGFASDFGYSKRTRRKKITGFYQ